MLLDKFKQFLTSNADEMYISGQAGTGKTTALKELAQYCLDSHIDCIATAFTHKAVKILVEKLPEKMPHNTIHGFLKKIPFDNYEALKKSHITSNKQIKEPEMFDVIFFDEYSMIGKKDKYAIDNLIAKKVFIGDPNQLLPVNDKPAITPTGDFNILLEKVWRQKDSEDLLENLILLSRGIHYKMVPSLKWGEHLIKVVDIKSQYKKLKACKILSWTNKNVQHLNALIESKQAPDIGDTIFCQTLNANYILIEKLKYNQVSHIIDNTFQYIDKKQVKENPLYALRNFPFVEYYRLMTASGIETVRAAIFGHGTYNDILNKYAALGVQLNNRLKKYSDKISEYSFHNPDNTLVRQRNDAWDAYKLLKNNVACFDFTHAMTIHKSQGSTYSNVILNLQDLRKLKVKQPINYLRLLYVGLSRASEKAFIYTGG